MNLQPLQDFIARHDLETAPQWSVLDINAQLGELVRALLVETHYGRNEIDRTSPLVREKIADLIFAVAYLCTLYGVEPDTALSESIARFESKLNARDEK